MATVTQQMYDFLNGQRIAFQQSAQQSAAERDQAEARRLEQQRLVDDLALVLADLEVTP